MTRRPWANYAIIGLNVLLYVAGYNGGSEHVAQMQLMLDPLQPKLYQFFSSIFLHAGLLHLLGNMIFLWVFGNAINDRFGQAGYLAFYLAGGVLACVGYLLLSANAPVLGASGAISAVTGAYLVLLPRARVTVLAWLFYVLMPFDISSLYFLLFQFIWNILGSATSMVGSGGGGVAYVAHAAGYLFGIGVAALLLAVRLLPRDPFDLLNMIRASQRRNRYRRMVNEGFDPFNYNAKVERQSDGRWVAAKNVEQVTPVNMASKELQLRRQISEAIERNDIAEAADKYLQLIQTAEDVVLGRQQQLDVANQLMSQEQYPAAADAYERFLKHYPHYEHVADIYLMLGLLYGRYLHEYERAEQLLTKAGQMLSDPRKLDLAQGDLQEVRRQRKS